VFLTAISRKENSLSLSEFASCKLCHRHSLSQARGRFGLACLSSTEKKRCDLSWALASFAKEKNHGNNTAGDFK